MLAVSLDPNIGEEFDIVSRPVWFKASQDFFVKLWPSCNLRFTSAKCSNDLLWTCYFWSRPFRRGTLIRIQKRFVGTFSSRPWLGRSERDPIGFDFQTMLCWLKWWLKSSLLIAFWDVCWLTFCLVSQIKNPPHGKKKKHGVETTVSTTSTPASSGWITIIHQRKPIPFFMHCKLLLPVGEMTWDFNIGSAAP